MRGNYPIDNMAMQQKASEACGTLAGSPYQPTLRERLTAQQARLSKQIEDVEAAIAALDKNPNFEEVLDVIGKAQY